MSSDQLYQRARELCPIGFLTPTDDATREARLEACELYVLAWRNDRGQQSNPDYPASAAFMLDSLGRCEEAKEAVDAALAIDPLHAEALGVHVSLSSKSSGFDYDFEKRQADLLRTAERLRSDKILGKVLDYIGEREEERLHSSVNEIVYRPGTLVVVVGQHGNGQRIALVSKSSVDHRTTLQLLDDEHGEDEAVNKEVSAGRYNTIVSSLRVALSKDHSDITTTPTGGENYLLFRISYFVFRNSEMCCDDYYYSLTSNFHYLQLFYLNCDARKNMENILPKPLQYEFVPRF
mgnify:CR=1 FL=1|jgi:hypothetical protein